MRLPAGILTRALVLVVALAAAAAGNATPSHIAKLTPAEQKWVTPLIVIWERQNAGLHLVIKQALKPTALNAGTKPDNLNLTRTLLALADCKQPKDLVLKAGKPPTTRLILFRDQLETACTHDLNGANDFAKAIGAVTSGKPNKVITSYLSKGAAEFKLGSISVQESYKTLTSLGASNLFKA